LAQSTKANIPRNYKITKMPIKYIYPTVVKYSKRPEYMYINNFHSKVLQNIPKLGFLVRKETIWQPCPQTVQKWGMRQMSAKRSSQLIWCSRVLLSQRIKEVQFWI
jgi:hypothetical protein